MGAILTRSRVRIAMRKCTPLLPLLGFWESFRERFLHEFAPFFRLGDRARVEAAELGDAPALETGDVRGRLRAADSEEANGGGNAGTLRWCLIAVADRRSGTVN